MREWYSYVQSLILCSEPSRVVLYTLAESGYIGFFDPTAAANDSDLYLVGRSLRPVAVAYDPVEKVLCCLLSLSATAKRHAHRIIY